MTDTIKLSDGREISCSKTVMALLKTCYEIASRGMEVTAATLSIIAPSHSKRDYTAACEIYRDEVRVRQECSVPMPVNVQEMCNNSIRLIWGTLCRHWESQIDSLKVSHQKELETSRKNHEFALDVNGKLEQQVKKLEDEITRMEGEHQKFRNESQAETASLKNECQELKQERKRLSADYQDFRKSRDSETDRLKSDYQKLKENSDSEIARLKGEIKSREEAESQLYQKYKKLAGEYDAYKEESCVANDNLRDKITAQEKEISELNDNAESLEEECGICHGKISDLEYLIAALRTQVSQYSDLYSKMHQLLTPFAIYCCQNSEKDRPEIDRLISDFKGSLTKILAETGTLIQGLSEYNDPNKQISNNDPVQPEIIIAAEKQPSAE
ncbi:hypothetical protein [Succinimonas amylolytica]|uniref:hypothetical protein n=1 Tax=Succinimonas amylolytica TaxID=83769 RepID=UPI00036B9DF9|nr:hypothetical protein [Succinimonas amylolytica]